MDKKLVEGIAIGAVAGAIATLLLAPKSGKETREDIRAHLDEIKDSIAERIGDAADFTRDKYEKIVKAVIDEYEAAKKITADEAKEIQQRLHDGYESVKGTAHDQAARAGCGCGS